MKIVNGIEVTTFWFTPQGYPRARANIANGSAKFRIPGVHACRIPWKNGYALR